MSGTEPTWKPGQHHMTVVSDKPCATVHAPAAVTGHNDTGYYGGYLVAESIPPELVPVIVAAPDLHTVLTELIHRKNECEEILSRYMEAKILAALAKVKEVPE